ncbi:MAG: multidrug effflux MFS transporter [Candidatus Krumholzibacteriia bacterium]
MGFKEFVALIAAMMALNALSIDPMLPALPAIGSSLGVADENHRQWVVGAYLLGLGVGSLFYGSLSDRYGRKPVLIICLIAFMAATLGCALATSFAMMIAGRAAAGFFAAASRVVAVSVVRDRFQGDRMARIMSLVFIVFMIVPILAPGFGQLVLHFASWRWIFHALVVVAGMLMLWAALRLPETLRPETRVEINVQDISRTWRSIVTHRSAFGYMLATGVVMSSLMGFITSVQQIFFDVFDAADLFPYAFAAIASFMAVGSFFNSRLVERIGARRMSHTSLSAFILLAVVHSIVAWRGHETLGTFMVLQAFTMLTFAFTSANFSSISLEPFARGAGAASSFQTFLTTMVAAVLGSAIGQQFDGTTLPMALGFLLAGIAAFLIVLWAERGKLFAPAAWRRDSGLAADDAR